MLPVLPAVQRGPSREAKWAQAIGGALVGGLGIYAENQRQKQLSQSLQSVNDIYSDPNLSQEQKFIKSFTALKNHPELAKQFSSGMAHFSESPLQAAQRRKLEGETAQLQSDENYFARLTSGGQKNAPQYNEPEETPFGMYNEEETPAEGFTPKTPKQAKFDLENPVTWTDANIRQFKAYKGPSKKGQSLAKMAEDEFTRRQGEIKTGEKTAKSAKEQQAVKNLLRETGKFPTEEELDAAAKVYDLTTARAMWQAAKKPTPKTESQKLLDKEMAKGYVSAIGEIPKLEATLSNISRLRELGGKLHGIGGYIKAGLNTQSAAEYNTLGASLLDPVIKVFNPVGAVPTSKLNWIKDTFSPKASDLTSTQEGKLATLERLAQQAQQRAQQKIKLFKDYNGEPPESAVLQFDNESAQMMNDFVANHQYIDQLKKEVPEGKILMIDANGKPLHVDPSLVMPNGMSAVGYATQFGARVIE